MILVKELISCMLPFKSIELGRKFHPFDIDINPKSKTGKKPSKPIITDTVGFLLKESITHTTATRNNPSYLVIVRIGAMTIIIFKSLGMTVDLTWVLFDSTELAEVRPDI
jgi:hypothetical protein